MDLRHIYLMKIFGLNFLVWRYVNYQKDYNSRSITLPGPLELSHDGMDVHMAAPGEENTVKKDRGKSKKKPLNLLLILAMVLLLVANSVFSIAMIYPWGEIHIQEKIAGGGLLGSLGGDLGGLGGIAGGVTGGGNITAQDNITIEANLTMYSYGVNYSASSNYQDINRSGDVLWSEGIGAGGIGGDLGDTFGLLKGSKKEYKYYISPFNWHADAEVSVHTQIETVPFWPAGVGQLCTITVKLEDARNVSRINVNDVSIELWANWNESSMRYQQFATIWSTTAGDALSQVGDSVQYQYSISLKGEINESLERIGVLGRANITMIDNVGDEEIFQQTDLPQNQAPILAINVWPMTTLDTISLVFVVSPLIMGSVFVVLNLITVYLVYKRRKRAKIVPLITGTIAMLTPLLFMNSIHTLVKLVGLDVDLAWGTGLYIPFAAAGISFAAFAFILLGLRERKDGTALDSGGPSEAEAANVTITRVCPTCGEVIPQEAETCPDCTTGDEVPADPGM